MEKYKALVLARKANFGSFQLVYVLREENHQEDTLSQLASYKCTDLPRSVYAKTLVEPIILKEHCNNIQEKATWMDNMILFLRTSILLEDKKNARKVMISSASFCLFGRCLYLQRPRAPSLLCIAGLDEDKILQDTHEELCSNKEPAWKLVQRTRQKRVFWPCMLARASKIQKNCVKCKERQIGRYSVMMVSSIMTDKSGQKEDKTVISQEWRDHIRKYLKGDGLLENIKRTHTIKNKSEHMCSKTESYTRRVSPILFCDASLPTWLKAFLPKLTMGSAGGTGGRTLAAKVLDSGYF